MIRQFARVNVFLGMLLISLPFTAVYAVSQPTVTTAKTSKTSAGPDANMVHPHPKHETSSASFTTPPAPSSTAKGYFLMDAYSGKVLAVSNPDQRMAPASLTKMMTSYIVSKALREGRIHLDNLVTISSAAWKTGGSKMFIKVGDQVSVGDLMQGIIVDSGNDACVAIAEFLAGSEEAFVNLMNQQAARLGMKDTHFTDVNGLPDPNHYSTPRDMAILARALIFDFPEDYKWYSQKWFTYNNIKQPNRNRLLWRDSTVDGVKTGHTDDAGYCLVASAQRHNTRLISVVMGAASDALRAEDSEKLLTYGFRFFQTRQVYPAHQPLMTVRVWQGANKMLSVGLSQAIYATVPAGHASQTKSNVTLYSPLKAPFRKGQEVGMIEVTLNGGPLATVKLVALEDNPLGNLWRRLTDKISIYFNH